MQMTYSETVSLGPFAVFFCRAEDASIIMEDMTIPIKIAWALIEEVPLLLGRLDVFPRFKIVFDEQQEIVTFQPS